MKKIVLKLWGDLEEIFTYVSMISFILFAIQVLWYLIGPGTYFKFGGNDFYIKDMPFSTVLTALLGLSLSNFISNLKKVLGQRREKENKPKGKL